MRKLPIFAFVALACAAILTAPSVRAQGYQLLQRNCPSCVVTFGSLTASTVTASTSVQTPDIKGAGGNDRILLPSGDVTTFKGGTSTANGLAITGTGTGVAPSLSATGSDTNIDIVLGGKGTGGEQLAGKVTKYNGTPTAGGGVSPTVAYGSLLATGTSGTAITSFTVGASNGLFEIGGYLDVTAWTSGTVAVQANYTDCRGTSHTSTSMFGALSTGSSAATISSTGTIDIFPKAVCAQSGTAITVQTSLGGTATADFYGYINQVN